MKEYIKMEKNNHKIWWKQKPYQHKISILIKNIDIDKTVVSSKVCSGKKGFKYFISYKGAKSDLYVYLMKISTYLFWQKMMNY